MNKYILLEETNGERFAVRVNALIADGWRLSGPLVYVVKYDSVTDSWAYFYAREMVHDEGRTLEEMSGFQQGVESLVQ